MAGRSWVIDEGCGGDCTQLARCQVCRIKQARTAACQSKKPCQSQGVVLCWRVGRGYTWRRLVVPPERRPLRSYATERGWRRDGIPASLVLCEEWLPGVGSARAGVRRGFAFGVGSGPRSAGCGGERQWGLDAGVPGGGERLQSRGGFTPSGKIWRDAHRGSDLLVWDRTGFARAEIRDQGR